MGQIKIRLELVVTLMLLMEYVSEANIPVNKESRHSTRARISGSSRNLKL